MVSRLANAVIARKNDYRSVAVNEVSFDEVSTGDGLYRHYMLAAEACHNKSQMAETSARFAKATLTGYCYSQEGRSGFVRPGPDRFRELDTR
jgi:hypothetical protein